MIQQNCYSVSIFRKLSLNRKGGGALSFIFLLFFLLFYNLWNSKDYLFTSFDGFQYLALAKSFWEMKFDYKLTYRSPVVYVLLLPDITLARIELILVYSFLVFLFYLFIKKYEKRKIAFYAFLLYGFCWWNILFTINTVVEYFALVFLLGGLLSKGWKRGLLYGIAFLIRPDLIVFIIPSIFLSKIRKTTWITFLLVLIGIEPLLDKIFYNTFIPSYLRFFEINFIRKLPWSLKPNEIYWQKVFSIAPYLSFLPGVFFAKKKLRNFLIFSFILISLIGFLPATNERIFFTKLIFLLSIAGSILLNKFKRNLKIAILIFLLAYNILIVLNMKYPKWVPEIECKDVECSNFPALVYLECGKIVKYAKIGECESGIWLEPPYK